VQTTGMPNASVVNQGFDTADIQEAKVLLEKLGV
jgi:hypothetical protein